MSLSPDTTSIIDDASNDESENQDGTTDVAGSAPKKVRIRFERWPAVKRALLSHLPGYQALHKGESKEKREWRKKALDELIKECPEDMRQEFGLAKIRKASTNHTMYTEPGNAPWGAPTPAAPEATSSHDSDTTSPKSSRTPKTLTGSDNPLAKALRARKPSPMRLWGAAHNNEVQKEMTKHGETKIDRWSHWAGVLWRRLSDAERAEWAEKAEQLSVAAHDQCFQNQLGISKLLASLLHDMIGMGPTCIGKSCFWVRLAYRGPDGQMIFEDISLAEDDDAPNYSHYEGGMSAEEDERWARWAGDVVGSNPEARVPELDYDENGPRLPTWQGEDCNWMKRVLRAYFKVKWESGGHKADAGWWDTVVQAPEEHVDGLWLDAFEKDPFTLEAFPLSMLYHRLHEAEREGSSFNFQPIQVAQELVTIAESLDPASVLPAVQVQEPGMPLPQSNVCVQPPPPQTESAYPLSTTGVDPSATEDRIVEATGPMQLSTAVLDPVEQPQGIPWCGEFDSFMLPTYRAANIHGELYPMQNEVGLFNFANSTAVNPGGFSESLVSDDIQLHDAGLATPYLNQTIVPARPEEYGFGAGPSEPIALSARTVQVVAPSAPVPVVATVGTVTQAQGVPPAPTVSAYAGAACQPTTPTVQIIAPSAPVPVVATVGTVTQAQGVPPAPTVSAYAEAVIAHQHGEAPNLNTPMRSQPALSRRMESVRAPPVSGLPAQSTRRRASSAQPQSRSMSVPPQRQRRASSVQLSGTPIRPSSILPDVPPTPQTMKRLFTVVGSPSGARTPTRRMRSESPTRHFTSGGHLPGPQLGSISEEWSNDTMEADSMRDGTSITMSSPGTTASMLDPMPCDLHVAEFIPASQSEEMAPPTTDLGPSGAGHEGASTSVANVQNAIGRKRGRAKVTVPPSTRQLRKRGADELPKETNPATADSGSVSKRLKGAEEDTGIEVNVGVSSTRGGRSRGQGSCQAGNGARGNGRRGNSVRGGRARGAPNGR